MFARPPLHLRGRQRSVAGVRTTLPRFYGGIPLVAAAGCSATRDRLSRSSHRGRLPLFLVPAVAAQRLFSLYQEQRLLTEDLVVAYGRLERRICRSQRVWWQLSMPAIDTQLATLRRLRCTLVTSLGAWRYAKQRFKRSIFADSFMTSARSAYPRACLRSLGRSRLMNDGGCKSTQRSENGFSRKWKTTLRSRQSFAIITNGSMVKDIRMG